MMLGRILGKKSKPLITQAEQSILQGMAILEELKHKPWFSVGFLFLGELYAETGQKEKALENLKKMESEFKAMGMDYYLRRTQEVLERVEAA